MLCSTMHFKMLQVSMDTHMSRIARVVIPLLPRHAEKRGLFHTLTPRSSRASTLNAPASKTGHGTRFLYIHDLVYIIMNKWYL
jgi:hypothetical protein